MLGKCVFRSVSVAALVLALTSSQQAQAQRGGRGMMGGQGVNPLGIVSNEAVQKDLGVKEDLVAKLKDLADDVREESMQQIQGAGIDFAGLRDLAPEERAKRMTEIQAKMAEINKSVNDKFRPKLAEILDKKQMDRLQEIAIQAAGSGALLDADVAKKLDISKDQTDKLKKIAEDFGKKQREAFASAGGDRSQAQAKMAELREEQTVKSTEVLSKDQQAKFASLKGKAFDVSKLRQMGRRRNNN